VTVKGRVKLADEPYYTLHPYRNLYAVMRALNCSCDGPRGRRGLFCSINGEGKGPEPVVVNALWKEPKETGEILRKLRAENEDLYRLEELLENGGDLPAEAVEV